MQQHKVKKNKKTIRRRKMSTRVNSLKNSKTANTNQNGGAKEPYCKFVFTNDFAGEPNDFKNKKMALCYSKKKKDDCIKTKDQDVDQRLDQLGYTDEQRTKICEWTQTDYDNSTNYPALFEDVENEEENKKSLIPRATLGNLSGKCVNKSVLGSLFNSKNCAQHNNNQTDCIDAGCKFEPESSIASMLSANIKNRQQTSAATNQP